MLRDASLRSLISKNTKLSWAQLMASTQNAHSALQSANTSMLGGKLGDDMAEKLPPPPCLGVFLRPHTQRFSSKIMPDIKSHSTRNIDLSRPSTRNTSTVTIDMQSAAALSNKAGSHRSLFTSRVGANPLQSGYD